MKKILQAFFIFCFLVESHTVTAQSSDDYIVHTIKHGEVISVLAKKYNVTVEEIIQLNKLGPNPILHVGDKVRLPLNAHLSPTADTTVPAAPVAQPVTVNKAPAPLKKDTVLQAPPKTPNYVMHTIEHGEVLSVLAKKYNVTVAEIAELNKLGTNPILHVGERIKLPPGAHLSLTTDSTKLAGPVKPPVTVNKAPAPIKKDTIIAAASKAPNYVLHTVQHGEVLSVLAKKYHVTVEEIVKLNKLGTNPILHVGDVIKLPPGASETASSIPQTVDQPTTPVVVTRQAEKITDTTAQTPADANIHIVRSKETLYGIGRQYKVTVDQLKSWNNLKDNTITAGQKLIIRSSSTNIGNTTATPPVVSKPTQPVTASNAPLQNSTPTKKIAPPVPPDASLANIPAEGFFTPMFGKDVAARTLQTSTGTAMTFKTASGWTDKKYYILMNDVPPGSIVKISSGDGKSVYAKILWNMGDMKDNEGLNYRISDAAASALGIKDSKFQVTITYYE